MSAAAATDGTANADIETGNLEVESNLPPEPEIGKGFLKPIPETTPLERVAGGAAVMSVGTALAAMILEGSAVVLIGGILSAVVGPYAYWQQVQLTDIKALQETQQKIQQEVGKFIKPIRKIWLTKKDDSFPFRTPCEFWKTIRYFHFPHCISFMRLLRWFVRPWSDRLTAENNRLAKNIDEMSNTVQDLKDIEDALEVITKTQGQTVDAFAQQVEKSREILKGMQSNLKTNVLQNLISLVLGSDVNQDNIVNETEVDELIRRIGNMTGVEIHEDKFRAAVVNKHVNAVMDVIKNLLQDDLPEDERIFVLAE